MKGKVYTKEFKDMVLQEVNETNDVAQVARRHDLSTKTIYNWRKQAGHKAWSVTEPTAKKWQYILLMPRNLRSLRTKMVN